MEKFTRLEITNIDIILKREFKASCVANGTTMKNVLIELMKKYVTETKINQNRK